MKKTKEQYLSTADALNKLALQTQRGESPKLQKIGKALRQSAKTKQMRADHIGKPPRRSRNFGG